MPLSNTEECDDDFSKRQAESKDPGCRIYDLQVIRAALYPFQRASFARFCLLLNIDEGKYG